MPKIKGETDPGQKALQFKKTFFSKPLALTNKDLTGYVYKYLHKTPEKISTQKIYKAIYELSSKWTLELNNISSKILKAITDIIMLYVHFVFN